MEISLINKMIIGWPCTSQWFHVHQHTCWLWSCWWHHWLVECLFEQQTYCPSQQVYAKCMSPVSTSHSDELPPEMFLKFVLCGMEITEILMLMHFCSLSYVFEWTSTVV